ncbi:MAG: IS1595 family transposase [Paracoccaceae bacterium]|nr:IS1595 family transposase [Paracoccaceae bacterium]
MDTKRFRSLCAHVDALSVEQLRALRRRLRALDARREVLARIDTRGQMLERCVHCNGQALVRWGSTRSGLQRLRCKGCGRSFSAATGTVVARIRLPEKLQQALADMLGPAPSSCRRLAARLGVDKMTVWRWRMAVLRALEGVGADGLGGIVEADETFQRESRKGSREWVRHERDPERCPAPPRPRWRDFRRRRLPLTTGLSKWQVPILTLTDRAGAHRADRLPDRRAESLVAVLRDRVRQDAVLCSDGDDAYRVFTQARGMPHYRIHARRGPKVIHGAFHIQTVNSLHSRFKAFMKPLCGPATKNLPAYIAWFIARLAGPQTAQNNAWNRMLAA